MNWYQAVAYSNAVSRQEGLEECYVMDGCAGSLSGADPRSPYLCESVSFAGLDCEGYRLPTEAEWEFAARAGTETSFFTGPLLQLQCAPLDENLDPIGWYCGNAPDGSRPVAQKQANALGLFDMHGNVAEWVWDVHWQYPDAELVVDPVGPEWAPPARANRGFRGGAANLRAERCRSSERAPAEPDVAGLNLGFRLVRTVQ